MFVYSYWTTERLQGGGERFHNVTIVDMAGATGPSVSEEDLSSLRRLRAVSLVAGMSKRQIDLGLMHLNCKARVSAHPTGACTYFGRNIVHVMACHMSSFHLKLGQLWRCPVSWCTQWKGTPHDCIDHIRKKHNVGDSVKTASLVKWFPPWTVTKAEWPVIVWRMHLCRGSIVTN